MSFLKKFPKMKKKKKRQQENKLLKNLKKQESKKRNCSKKDLKIWPKNIQINSKIALITTIFKMLKAFQSRL